MSPLVGLFVGGAARRMDGRQKGLIVAAASGESLIARNVRLARELGLSVCLVGEGRAYSAALPALDQLSDAPAGVGPLGGLRALCLGAGARPVIALACDLPYLSRALLARLASEQPSSRVLAPRGSAGFWEPLFARYDPPGVLPLIDALLARGERSLQALLREAMADELALDDAERASLTDWDSPSDLASGYLLPERGH